MKCREFIIEFEDRQTLSAPALYHLTICADCKKSSETQTRIWRAIDAFAKVDAPHDFNFKVKAKIAKTDAKNFKPRFFPVALRYAAPLGLLILIVGVIAFVSINFSENSVPQVAENQFQSTDKAVSKDYLPLTNSVVANVAPPVLPEVKTSTPIENESAAQSPENTLIAVETRKKSSPPTKNSAKDNFKGSRDSSLTKTTPRLPKGFNLNSDTAILPNVGGTNSMSDETILAQLGIETVLENGDLKVKSIKPNSIAARSGVQVGDVIEAVNKNSTNGESNRAAVIEAKKLMIRRGAEKIEINLQNSLN